MLLLLGDQYSEAKWDAMPHPRRFFQKHRGLRSDQGKADLPAFRALFLRAALAQAQRAAEVAPTCLEAACLHCCCLWSLALNQEADANGWGAMLRQEACAAFDRLAQQQGGDAAALEKQHSAECLALYPASAAGRAPSRSARLALLANLGRRAAALSVPLASEASGLGDGRVSDELDALEQRDSVGRPTWEFGGSVAEDQAGMIHRLLAELGLVDEEGGEDDSAAASTTTVATAAGP